MKTMMMTLFALMLMLVQPLAAQEDGFAPAAHVNARVISQYEVKQRILFMKLLRQPGDITKLALDTLIDDAIRRDAAKKMGIMVTDDEVKAGMGEFASRANLPLDQFLKALAQGGVEPETMRDFVQAGLVWRGVVRTKFADSTKITDAEVDRAIAAGASSGGEMRVLLAEIVLPTGGAQDALALARRLRLTATTERTFGMAAQSYSKAASAKAGGALGWIPVSALPPEVKGKILALKPGEVTEPIAVPGAVQLYYLRDVSMTTGDAKGPAEVDYMQFFAPAGTDLVAVGNDADKCDDLYDATRGLPPEALQRQKVLEASLSPALRSAMAGLDAGEKTVIAGNPPSLIMLCARAPQSDLAPSRDDVLQTLLNGKLNILAGAYLTELRSNAIIRIP